MRSLAAWLFFLSLKLAAANVYEINLIENIKRSYQDLLTYQIYAPSQEFFSYKELITPILDQALDQEFSKVFRSLWFDEDKSFLLDAIFSINAWRWAAFLQNTYANNLLPGTFCETDDDAVPIIKRYKNKTLTYYGALQEILFALTGALTVQPNNAVFVTTKLEIIDKNLATAIEQAKAQYDENSF
jgi:hypothetical protein